MLLRKGGEPSEFFFLKLARSASFSPAKPWSRGCHWHPAIGVLTERRNITADDTAIADRGPPQYTTPTFVHTQRPIVRPLKNGSGPCSLSALILIQYIHASRFRLALPEGR